MRRNAIHLLEDAQRARQQFVQRALVAALFGIVLLAVVAARYAYLQVVRYEFFETRAVSNRVQLTPLPPTRGRILDRRGRILADNRASFTLVITPERAGNVEGLLERLQAEITLSPAEIQAFRRARAVRRQPFAKVPLKRNLSEAEVAHLAVREYDLPGVSIEAELERIYPFGSLTAHTVGYVGALTERDLADMTEAERTHYRGTFVHGRAGLERVYERALLGQVGSQQVEVNAHGRTLRVLAETPPSPGTDLRLAMDIELQAEAYNALAGRRGAVVALDPRTFEVLAMVSAPSFDANSMVGGISSADYSALLNDPDLPLFDRALLGQYPPGSTLKPMLALGGLASGATTVQRAVADPGYYQLPNDVRLYRDWKPYGHGGRVDMTRAIVESCDVYFYDLAHRMGVGVMHPLGEAFGLGRRTGIDLSGERAGLWPSPAGKRAARKQAWFPGDSLNMSIGQGDVLTTPLQLAVMTGALANRGPWREPRLVPSATARAHPGFAAGEADWRAVIDAMVQVVNGPRGTAKVIAPGLTYSIAGKTGTAQVIGIAQNTRYDRNKVLERQRDHALFIAFAPADNPTIAIAVVVENGEHGSSVAAPVARAVMDRYFAARAGGLERPL